VGAEKYACIIMAIVTIIGGRKFRRTLNILIDNAIIYYMYYGIQAS
jgi:hypothetical protein